MVDPLHAGSSSLQSSSNFEQRTSTKFEASKNKSTFPSFVIQKYMERPLLYKQHKFDIRAFALVTHEMQLLVFE